MTYYEQEILNLKAPTFKQIKAMAEKHCGKTCTSKDVCKPWKALNHGVALLDTHEQLCKYLCSYGDMHEEKMKVALNSIQNPQDVLNRDLTIIDWGCGQGLGTICFFDYLLKNNIRKRTQKVILIEPSSMALGRAKLHVETYLKDATKITTVKKYLDDVTSNDVKTNTPIVIHFFSNILDIKEIDLKKLADRVGKDQSKEQYIFCVSPLNNGHDRIDEFFNFFKESEKIAEKKISNLPVCRRTLRLLVFKLVAGKIELIKIEYDPSVQFHAAYQLDVVSKACKDLTIVDKGKYELNTAFELSAPFDIGASISDDVHPIFAVLNNIITRGLPTRTSPFIEHVFEAFGNKRQVDDLGNIKYNSDNFKPEDLLSSIEYLTPLAVARVQKTIIEALMTGKVSIDQSVWNVIVLEQDVPCAAIAFEDFRQMFEHLTAFSKEYSNMKFPQINLEILCNEKFVDSKLHLSIHANSEPTKQQLMNIYDMVIDVSMFQKHEPINESFTQFKSNNNCYFKIRSASVKRSKRYIYTTDAIEYLPLVTKDSQGVFHTIVSGKEHLQYFLQLIFRKEDFRPGQLPILDRALQNKCVIGLLPTGGGKSLTYQLAGMLQPGVTLIIDPLRSLMKDQYDGLIKVGIDTCTFINTTIDSAEKDFRLKQMQSSQMQFVFLSPERLCIYAFRQSLKAMRDMHVYFAYGVIDEVHCVSEWGHDFRFSYLHLGRNLYNYVLPKDKDKRLTLFGLTATASFDVLADVERELSGNGAFNLDADTIIRYENTNRLELQYKIERVPIQFERDQSFDRTNQLNGLVTALKITDKWAIYNSKQEFLKDNIAKTPTYILELQSNEGVNLIKSSYNIRQNSNEDLSDIDLKVNIPINFFRIEAEYDRAGIVFCPHKDNTGLAVFSNEKSLRKITPNIGTFVGSSEDDDTDAISFENLEKFRDNKLSLMVATKAFGMGIDKPNVRFTINMNYSSSLESFVQEAGRAGRDRKIALSTILVADYRLVRINSKCPINQFPLAIIKNKWFKEDELQKVLLNYKILIDNKYYDYFTPEHDLVKLHCEKCNTRFAFNNCESKCEKYNECNLKVKGYDCKFKCQYYDDCKLKDSPNEARGIHYLNDLEEILKNHNLEIPKVNIEYLNADYDTVMYFYNKNFKGAEHEKKVMHQLLSAASIGYTESNNEDEDNLNHNTIAGFLSTLLNSKVNSSKVFYISYVDKKDYNELDRYEYISKAIYRMCCIDLIDDFTQDYANGQFRIVTKRKADGEYYKALKRFLMRYYSEDRAEEEIQKVPERKGDNEVHKCLGYLTEFIYAKIAVKRKRAIDDMRTFCIQGLNETKDWKEVNEDLKDFIYYYFNSKYAKANHIAYNDEPFSLVDDTDEGKNSPVSIIFKYMRVVDVDDKAFGPGETPKDNIKHLHGAVKLIRRSLTDTNPALDLLNAFCLFYLGTNGNAVLEIELRDSYKNGLLGFAERIENISEFWNFFDDYHNSISRNAKEFPIEYLNDIKDEIIAEIHGMIVRSLTNRYTKI